MTGWELWRPTIIWIIHREPISVCGSELELVQQHCFWMVQHIRVWFHHIQRSFGVCCHLFELAVIYFALFLLASVNSFFTALLNAQASAQSGVASSAGTSLQAAITSLATFGATPSLLATGTYSWTDIDIVHDVSSLPSLTNSQCSRVMSFVSTVRGQSGFHSDVVAQMVNVLPVSRGGVSFPGGNLTCGPFYPLGTADDQRAVFSVQGLQLTALYTEFGRLATYVTYANSSVDHSLQPAEIASLLNSANVRTSLQDAMRVVVLSYLRQYYGLRLNVS